MLSIHKGKKMKKWLHRIFVVLVLGVFVVSAVKLVTIWAGYQKSKNIQQEAVQEYTRVSSAAAGRKGSCSFRTGCKSP